MGYPLIYKEVYEKFGQYRGCKGHTNTETYIQIFIHTYIYIERVKGKFTGGEGSSFTAA